MKRASLIVLLTTVWVGLAPAQIPVTDASSTLELTMLNVKLLALVNQVGTTLGAGTAVPVVVPQTPILPLGITTTGTNLLGTNVTSYNGSKLLSLGGAGGTVPGVTSLLGGGLYPALPVATPSAGWSNKYSPYVFMEGMTDKTVDTFNQADQNMLQLRVQLTAAVAALTGATSLSQVEVIHAKISAIQAAIAQQQYIREAAMQQVQLVALANQNNQAKRTLADLESKSEDHANSLGVNPTSISGAVQAATLLGFMSDMRTAAQGPDSLTGN